MSAFGDAAMVPPEVNHTLMLTGDDGLSLTAAGAGHQALADMLLAELAQMGFNTSTVAATGFQGLGGTAMTANATEQISVLTAAVAWLQVASMQAMEVVSAHQAALTAMIPAEVALTNRSTNYGLIATNFFGQNSPGIAALEAQYAEFWTQNAQLRTSFGAAVTAALAALAVPAPLNPAMADPGEAAAATGQSVAAAGAQGGLQAAAQSMTSATDATGTGASQAAQAPASGMSSMTSEFGSVLGSATSMLSSGGGLMNPSMLSSAPSMLSGLMGSLGSGMGGGAGPAGLSAAEAAAAAGPAMSGGAGALGGAGGLGGGAPTLASSLVRPASSFSTPNAPKLPGGWGGSAAEPAAAKPSNSGGGGLFGAPGAMGQHGSSKGDKAPTRSVQLTTRQAAHREEEARI